MHFVSFNHLGSFDSEEAAARAFDTAARHQRGAAAHGGRCQNGSHSRLNFPTAEEQARMEEFQTRQVHHYELTAVPEDATKQ